MLQASADYGKVVAEMEKTDHAFDVNAPGERPYIVPAKCWNLVVAFSEYVY